MRLRLASNLSPVGAPASSRALTSPRSADAGRNSPRNVGGYIEPDTDPSPARTRFKNTSTPARRKDRAASSSPAHGCPKGAEDSGNRALLRRIHSDECLPRDGEKIAKQGAEDTSGIENATPREPSPPLGVALARSNSLNDLSHELERRPLEPFGILPFPILKRRANMNAQDGKCVCWDEVLEQIIEYTVDLDACMEEGRASHELLPEPLAVEGRLSAYYQRSLKRIASPPSRTNLP